MAGDQTVPESVALRWMPTREIPYAAARRAAVPGGGGGPFDAAYGRTGSASPLWSSLG